MSSYELFVHDPIRPADSSSFQPCSLTKSPNFESGVARSGVKGPLMVGSSSDKFYDRENHRQQGSKTIVKTLHDARC